MSAPTREEIVQDYFVLEPDSSTSAVATLDIGENAEMDLRWLEGRLIEPGELAEPLRILVEEPPEGGRYPDFMNVGHGPAVSQAFRDAVATLPVSNVEFHRTEIVEDAGPLADPYFMMNVIGLLDALDQTRTQVTMFKRRVFRMKSLAIDPAAARDLDLFRLHDYADIIIVSGRVADRLLSTSLSGFLLSPADGWSDQHRF